MIQKCSLIELVYFTNDTKFSHNFFKYIEIIDGQRDELTLTLVIYQRSYLRWQITIQIIMDIEIITTKSYLRKKVVNDDLSRSQDPGKMSRTHNVKVF